MDRGLGPIAKWRTLEERKIREIFGQRLARSSCLQRTVRTWQHRLTGKERRHVGSMAREHNERRNTGGLQGKRKSLPNIGFHQSGVFPGRGRNCSEPS